MRLYSLRSFPVVGVLLALSLLGGGLPIAIAKPYGQSIDDLTGQREGNANQSVFSFIPPDRGLPGRREGGGTRKAGEACTQGEKNLGRLVALVPEKNLGLTTAKYPRFYWFFPKTKARYAEFQLYDVDKQSVNRTLIYKSTFAIDGEPGIKSLLIPSEASIPALKGDRDYRWSLSLICDPENRTDGDIKVYGGVERVSLDSDVVKQLEQLSPRDRLFFYGRKGFWFDALTTLAELRACDPDNTALSDNWNSLLGAVKLQDYAQQPLVQQCPNPQSSAAISSKLAK